MFSVKISNDGINNAAALSAAITIDDFSEPLLIPTASWSPKDYKEQWKKAVYDLAENGEQETMLVTEMYDPEKANFINVWLLYKDGELGGSFDIKKLESYTPKRKTLSDAGEEISEWTTSISALRQWAKKL